MKDKRKIALLAIGFASLFSIIIPLPATLFSTNVVPGCALKRLLRALNEEVTVYASTGAYYLEFGAYWTSRGAFGFIT